MNCLIYTLLVNNCHKTPWRTVGKIWAGSILNSRWDVEILLVKDFESKLFNVARKNVDEAVLTEESMLIGPPPFSIGPITGSTLSCTYRKARLQAALDFIQPEEYSWIIISNPDHLIMRDISHLLVTEADMLVETTKPQNKFLDLIAIKGTCFENLVRSWLSILKSNTSATNHEDYNSALFHAARGENLSMKAFEQDEVISLSERPSCLSSEALPAILHVDRCPFERKVWLMTALYMALRYATPDGMFIDIIDA